MDFAEIWSKVRSHQTSADEALERLDRLRATASEDAKFWLLRGCLIQLADLTELSLDEARVSFERAAVLAPESPEPLEELGHFWFAVEDDAAKAVDYFRQALALGAGEETEAALSQALAELEEASPHGPAA